MLALAHACVYIVMIDPDKSILFWFGLKFDPTNQINNGGFIPDVSIDYFPILLIIRTVSRMNSGKSPGKA